MNALKKTICRSFERTIQVGQYQPAKFWAFYCEEVSVDTGPEEVKRISAFIYDLAKSDVETSINDFKKEQAQERIASQPKVNIKNNQELGSETYE